MKTGQLVRVMSTDGKRTVVIGQLRGGKGGELFVFAQNHTLPYPAYRVLPLRSN